MDYNESKFIAWIVWLGLPLFPLLGYLAFRFLPYRTTRWMCYLAFDITFLTFALLSINFSYDLLDYLALLFFVYTFSEFFWGYQLFNIKTIRFTGNVARIIIVILAILWLVPGWIAAKSVPQQIWVISAYEQTEYDYRVKAGDYANIPADGRTFSYSKRLKNLPIFEYEDGLFWVRRADVHLFTFDWTEDRDNVRLEIFRDGERIGSYVGGRYIE